MWKNGERERGQLRALQGPPQPGTRTGWEGSEHRSQIPGASPCSPLGLHIRIWLWHWTTGCRGGEAAAAGSGSEVVLVARSGDEGGEEEEEEEENCVWQRSCARDWGMPW